MNRYIQKNRAIVGAYKPSENWANYTQFAVMDEQTCSLLATVGYFQDLRDPEKKWDMEDYRNAAECIEQGQLYANAPLLFDAVRNLIENPHDANIVAEAKALLANITDISEASTRLLGENAMGIINAIKS